MTSGPAEVFDLGYQGYEGGDRPLGPSPRDLAGRDPDLARARARTGAKIAPWLLLGLALVPGGGARRRLRVRRPRDRPGRLRASVVLGVLRVGDGALALFAAVVAPLLICPDRRDGVLAGFYAARPITPLDYVGARWAAFLTVSLAAVWLPGDPLRLERARRTGARNLPGRQLGRRAPVPPRRLGHRDGADDTSALRRLVRDASRLRLGRDARGPFHRLRGGEASQRRTSRAPSPMSSRS